MYVNYPEPIYPKVNPPSQIFNSPSIDTTIYVSGGTGTFTVTGSDADTILFVRQLGSASSFLYNNARVVTLVTASTGTFTVTGGVADSIIFVEADGGSFTVSGGAGDALILASAGTGTFTVTGGVADVLILVAAGTGTFTVTGGPANEGEFEPGDSGTFTVTGGAADVLILVSASSGTYTLTGGNAFAFIGSFIAGGTGTFIVTGGDAFASGVTPPVTDTTGGGAPGKYKPRQPTQEEDYLEIERRRYARLQEEIDLQNEDDLEIVLVITDFLSRYDA